MALNPFFTEDHAINRATGEIGEDLGDPKCYYDPDLGRFFFTVLHLGQTPAGVFDGIIRSMGRWAVSTSDQGAVYL